jgi:AcrR family transcriptional regulator
MTPRAYRSPARDAAAEETRQRILRAAREIFAAGKPFSMEAVAKRARVTRITIYHQFESKVRLLEAVFDEVAVAGGLASLPQAMGQSDPRRALRDVIHIFVKFWSTHRDVLPRLSALLVDADINKQLQSRIERRRKILGVLVARILGAESLALTDTLFTLTNAEAFENLATRDRGPEEIEALVVKAVDAVVDSYI